MPKKAITITAKQAIKIVIAADGLESYLHRNVGTTDDWPVSIVTDDPKVSQEVAALFLNLRNALRPWRKANENQRDSKGH